MSVPGLIERAFRCPHCGERNSALLEPAGEERQMTVDCEVCCRPILLIWRADPWSGRDTLSIERE